MKKTLLLFIVLLAGISGAWAQITGTLVTGYGDPLSLTQFKALAGTTGRFAFVASSNTAADNAPRCDHWCGFTSTHNTTTLSGDYLFYLEASGDNYKVKRASDNKYVSTSTESTSFVESGGSEFKLVNRDPNDDTKAVEGEYSISFEDPTNSGNHYNANAVKYNGGTGAWTTYAVFGPIYVVTVNCINSSNSETIQTLSYYVKDGTTVNAPQIANYTTSGGSVTVNGADVVLNCNYTAIASASDVAGKTFTLRCARGYVYHNGTQLAGTNTAADASKFAIVSFEGDTYLYDATNNAFVCHTTAATAGNTGNAALESNNDFSKAVKNISFGSTGIASYPYYVQEDEFTNWLNMDGGPRVYLNRWTNFENGNGGNTYEITPVDVDFDGTDAVAMLDAYFNPSATVRYIISDGSSTVLTTDYEPATVGDNITALPSAYQRAFCSYTAINHTIVAGANDINVTVSYNLPFETGTDKLYYAKLRNHYVYYDATNTDVRANQTSKENTNAYRWSFYGNPYSGIKVKNAETGTYLDNTSSTVQLSAEGYGWTIHRLNETSTFGLYNGSNYINEQNTDNYNLIYWWAFSTDAGSQWTVEAVPDVAVNVTYELYVGGEKVNTVIVEEVAANSAVSVPTSLTANYSSLGYDFATSGTIGEVDCTITVTGTLKTNVIADLANLSNTKAYTLTTERGALYIKDSHLASNSNANAGATAGTFALLNYEDNYYLYSVDASKFVLGDGSLSETPTSAIATLTMTAQTIKPLYLMVLGGKGLNVTNTVDDYELVINAYVTPDAGNRYSIKEADDFNATTALAALEDYFHGTTAFNNAIAQLEAYPYGTGLNQYSMVVETNDYTSQAATIISGLKTQGYTAENLANAQLMLEGTSINLPTTGKFYRIKGNTSGNYLAAGMANSKFAMSNATDGTTVFYFDGYQLINIYSGMSNGMTASAWAWVIGDNASTVVFQDGQTNGGYVIQSSNAYFYDGGANADRGGTLGDNERYRSWYLTEVTTLPVTISSVGYATLYSPVALTIPTGVTAYIASDEGNYLHLTAIENSENVIPANTGVILAGNANTYDFTVTTTETTVSGNVLTGSVAAISRPENSYILATGDKGVGFYKDGATTIPGFKAYLQASAGVKGFLSFDFGTEDAIESIVNDQLTKDNAAIFNLAGQRISKLQKGVNIVNGKKVLVK